MELALVYYGRVLAVRFKVRFHRVRVWYKDVRDRDFRTAGGQMSHMHPASQQDDKLFVERHAVPPFCDSSPAISRLCAVATAAAAAAAAAFLFIIHL